jgi:malonyl-CoA/methylmalonyl-CoA synthetase
MVSGSAALPVRTLERWREVSGHVLLERYGMTETGMVLSNPLDGERLPGRVGQPLPGVEVRLVDDAGRVAQPGEAGEVLVRGPGVFLEYWQRSEETEQAFEDGWFRTGDVGVLEAGGYRLLGRKSVDIIKTGGYKVSALEIEDVMRSHPEVADCAVVGVEDAEWGERVCAAIETRGEGASVAALEQWARLQLAPYKVPRTFRLVGSLPRNALGKVTKPQVAALFGSDSGPV